MPAATPADIVTRLNREVRRIVAEPETRAKLLEMGAVPEDWDHAQLVAFTDAEVKKWAKVIQVSGAKVD